MNIFIRNIYFYAVIQFLLFTASIQPQQVDLTVCGTAYSCMTIPDGCTTPDLCDAVVRYVYNVTENVFTIELSTKNTWMAFTQQPVDSSAMSKIRGQYCARTANVSMGNLQGNNIKNDGDPQWKLEVDGVTATTTKNIDGIIICRFTRPVSPPNTSTEWLYNLNTSLRIVMAFGSNLRGGVFPSEHSNGDYSSTKDAVDFFKIAIIKGSVKIEEIVHGILMIISWILCATIGIFMSRYMKVATKDKKVLGKDGWFTAHVSLMVLCLFCFVAGLIAILILHPNLEVGKHQLLGVFTIITGLIQPLMALFRPTPDHKYRFIFNWSHRTVGILAWTLGGCSIIYAMKLFDKTEVPMIVFMVVVVALCVVLDILLMILPKREGGGTATFSDKTNSAEVTAAGGKPKPNTTASWVFLVIIVLLAIAFTIYHIYVVATL